MYKLLILRKLSRFNKDNTKKTKKNKNKIKKKRERKRETVMNFLQW